jgi:hypothetical protein
MENTDAMDRNVEIQIQKIDIVVFVIKCDQDGLILTHAERKIKVFWDQN